MSKHDNDKPLSVWSKLYRGQTDFQFVSKRRRWYLFSVFLMVASIAIMLIKGFTLGIDFAGGNKYTVPVGEATITQVEDAATAAGAEVASGQITGSGDDEAFLIRTAALDREQAQVVREAIADVTGVAIDEISVSEVSATWGAAVSDKALLSLIIFVVLIAGFIWLRFEWRMAISAISALGHDLVLTAGIFALIGFEITPSTLVGMLTVLAYSLYDTVVVFDKVQENTANLFQSRQKTFGERVNDAINETLMRSINTTFIGALPVGALLFIGVGLLGVGTLKDLALVLFVGIITGTYSSVFLAAPWLVDMAERSPAYRKHNQKVANRRASGRDEDAADEDAAPRAKTGDLPIALLEEAEPAKAGAGSRSSGPKSGPGRQHSKRRRKR